MEVVLRPGYDGRGVKFDQHKYHRIEQRAAERLPFVYFRRLSILINGDGEGIIHDLAVRRNDLDDIHLSLRQAPGPGDGFGGGA